MRILTPLLDLLLPPRCFGCGGEALDHQTLCPRCWKACHLLNPPWCSQCGYPFPYDTQEHWGGEMLCLTCHRTPPLFVTARSALAYDDGCRRFILALKHGDATHLAPGLATMMMRNASQILSQTDILIPVPLHWRRLFWRQYNQATLLSQGITRLSGIPTKTHLIKRHRATPQQGRQNLKKRYDNVRGAFRVPKAKIDSILGKRLTLIDDVYTTGSTITECARILLREGAKEIRVLTLARVIN